MPAAFKRCVSKVKAAGKASNPWAVCTAANAGGIKQYRKHEAEERRTRKARR
jgi:hypothetical protein